jgi:hypothetical protein
MTNRRDDWIDDDEYPSDRDVDAFGDDAPFDDDPLTIGKVRTRKRISGYRQSGYWTTNRIVVAVIAAILLLVFLLGELAPLLGR